MESFVLTEVSDCGLLIVVTSSFFVIQYIFINDIYSYRAIFFTCNFLKIIFVKRHMMLNNIYC